MSEMARLADNPKHQCVVWCWAAVMSTMSGSLGTLAPWCALIVPILCALMTYIWARKIP